MSAPRTITSTISREVAKVIADILQAEMGLDAAHCLLGNQQWDIPVDKTLFAVVFDDSGPTIGSTSYLDTDSTSPHYLKEVQQTTSLHRIRVEIMSFDADARLRKEEVGMALASLKAQQLADQYEMQIGRAQAPVDASGAETTKILARFVIAVNVTAMHLKVKDPPAGSDYFDKYNGAATDDTANPPEVTVNE